MDLFNNLATHGLLYVKPYVKPYVKRLKRDAMRGIVFGCLCFALGTLPRQYVIRATCARITSRYFTPTEQPSAILGEGKVSSAICVKHVTQVDILR